MLFASVCFHLKLYVFLKTFVFIVCEIEVLKSTSISQTIKTNEINYAEHDHINKSLPPKDQAGNALACMGVG